MALSLILLTKLTKYLARFQFSPLLRNFSSLYLNQSLFFCLRPSPTFCCISTSQEVTMRYMCTAANVVQGQCKTHAFNTKLLNFRNLLDNEGNISKDDYEKFLLDVEQIVDVHALPKLLLLMRDWRRNFASALDAGFLQTFFGKFEQQFLDIVENGNPSSVAVCGRVITYFECRNSSFDDLFWPKWYSVTEHNFSQLSMESICDTLCTITHVFYRPSVHFTLNLLAVANNTFAKEKLITDKDIQHVISLMFVFSALSKSPAVNQFDDCAKEKAWQLMNEMLKRGQALCAGNLHRFTVEQLHFIRLFRAIHREVSNDVAVEWMQAMTAKLPSINSVSEHFLAWNTGATLVSKAAKALQFTNRNHKVSQEQLEFFKTLTAEFLRLLSIADSALATQELLNEIDVARIVHSIFVLSQFATQLLPTLDKFANAEAIQELINTIVFRGQALCADHLFRFTLEQLNSIRVYRHGLINFEVCSVLAVDWLRAASVKLLSCNNVDEHFLAFHIAAKLVSKAARAHQSADENRKVLEAKREFLDAFKREFIRLEDQLIRANASLLLYGLTTFATPRDPWTINLSHKLDRRIMATMDGFKPRELAMYGMNRAALASQTRMNYPSPEWLEKWLDYVANKADILNAEHVREILNALYRFAIRDMEVLRRLDSRLSIFLPELSGEALINMLHCFIGLRYFPQQELWQSIVSTLKDCDKLPTVLSLVHSLCYAQLCDGILSPDIVHVLNCTLLERLDAALYGERKILRDLSALHQLNRYKFLFGNSWLPAEIREVLARPNIFQPLIMEEIEMLQHERVQFKVLHKPVRLALQRYAQRKTQVVQVEEDIYIAPVGIAVPFLLRPHTSHRPRDSVVLLYHTGSHYYCDRTGKIILSADGLTTTADMNEKLLTKLGYTVCDVPIYKRRNLDLHFQGTIAPVLATKFGL